MRKIKSLSDEDLVILVREKDQELYTEVIKRYQEKLIRYARYLIADENMAEDAVQEAFIKVFMNLNGFDTKRKFSSWIYRIVHNETMNVVKKNRKEISLDDNSWVKEKIGKEDGIIDELEHEDVKEMLEKALGELPVKYRGPLVLRYYEDKSYDEISDVLRIPVGTVGTRINRGRKMLSVIYGKKGGNRG